MSCRVRKKCHPEPFAATLARRKPFEIRFEDDHVFQVGDEIVLEEFEPCAHQLADCAHEPKGVYSGRSILARVTHVERGPSWGLPAGLAVLALEFPEDRT